MTAAAERAGRDPAGVRLVAVTKTVGMDEVLALAGLGVTDFGESRVDAARPKIASLDLPARWHMIGTVQRRKARDVAALFDCVHSIDRADLAEALDRQAGERGKTLDAFIEVNVSGEESKHGFRPDEVEGALKTLAGLPHLRVSGLMTMAPFVDDPEAVRPVFARLRALAECAGLPELSMGMSNDFETAIEEGATLVRIGTALFV
jgi:pyridoxal phosphate enzyme (YggS family)